MSSRVYAASCCSSGQRESTQVPLCVRCAPPRSKMKTIIQSSVDGGGLKITGLKPLNDGFLGLPACVIARGVHFHMVPGNHQKSPKKRAEEVRRFHIPRTCSACQGDRYSGTEEPGTRLPRLVFPCLPYLPSRSAGEATSLRICFPAGHLSGRHERLAHWGSGRQLVIFVSLFQSLISA